MKTSIDPARSLRARRFSRRAQKRGASLVEAAVVLPILCMFLGLNLYVKAAYDERIYEQSTTRRETAFYASHACQGSGGTDTEDGGEYGPPATSEEDPGQKDERTGDALSRKFNTAVKKMSKEVKEAGLTRKVSAASWMMCNEKGGFGDVFKTMINMAIEMFKGGD